MCVCNLYSFSCCDFVIVEMLVEIKELMVPTDLLSPSTDKKGAVLVVQPLIMCSLLNVLTSVYEALNRNTLVVCVCVRVCV